METFFGQTRWKNCVIDAKPFSYDGGGNLSECTYTQRNSNIHDTIERALIVGMWVRVRVRMSMKPRLDIKASELPLQMCTWLSIRSERKRGHEGKEKCVYINSQQLPLYGKNIIYCLVVERMLDNESATWNALRRAESKFFFALAIFICGIFIFNREFSTPAEATLKRSFLFFPWMR